MANKRRGSGRSVNRAELAAIFGVSTQTVDAWTRKGLAFEKVGSKVTFNTAAVIDWREAQAVERVASGITPSASIEEARLRKLNGDVVLVEMEIAQKRAELVPIADAVKVLAEPLTAVRAKMLALPNKLAPNDAVLRLALSNGIRNALSELVTEAGIVAGGDEAGGVEPDGRGDEAAADPDGERVGGLLSQAFT